MSRACLIMGLLGLAMCESGRLANDDIRTLDNCATDTECEAAADRHCDAGETEYCEFGTVSDEELDGAE